MSGYELAWIGEIKGIIRRAADGFSRQVPTGGERAVDRLQHRLQPLAHVGAAWQLKWNAGLFDLAFDAHQPLRHGGRGNEVGAGYSLSIDAQDGLQHHRGAQAVVNGGVGADEEQLHAVVGDGIQIDIEDQRGSPLLQKRWDSSRHAANQARQSRQQKETNRYQAQHVGEQAKRHTKSNYFRIQTLLYK